MRGARASGPRGKQVQCWLERRAAPRGRRLGDERTTLALVVEAKAEILAAAGEDVTPVFAAPANTLDLFLISAPASGGRVLVSAAWGGSVRVGQGVVCARVCARSGCVAHAGRALTPNPNP